MAPGRRGTDIRGLAEGEAATATETPTRPSLTLDKPVPGCRLQPTGAAHKDDRTLVVLLDVLNRCNLSCPMCGHDATQALERIDIESFRRLGGTLFPRCRHLALSCGYEPLTEHRFLDYLDFALGFGVPHVELTTNGTLLTPSIAAHLVESRLHTLVVSFDGATRATYESVRGNGNFDRLLANLQVFDHLRTSSTETPPRLQFNFVILRETADEIPAAVDLLTRFTPHKITFVHRDFNPPPENMRRTVVTRLREALHHCRDNGIIFTEGPRHLLSADEVLNAYGVLPTTTPTPMPTCLDPWRVIRILPNGDILPCPFIHEPAANLRSTPLHEVWNSPESRRLRTAFNDDRPPSTCAACPTGGAGLAQLYAIDRQLDELILESLARKP